MFDKNNNLIYSDTVVYHEPTRQMYKVTSVGANTITVVELEHKFVEPAKSIVYSVDCLVQVQDTTKLSFNKFVKLSKEFDIFPHSSTPRAYFFGVFSEAGEILGLYKKYLRGDKELGLDEVILETGDTLWYLARIYEAYFCDQLLFFEQGFEKSPADAYFFDVGVAAGQLLDECSWENFFTTFVCLCEIIHWCNSTLEETLELNLRKLHTRKSRGKLAGNGDTR